MTKNNKRRRVLVSSTSVSIRGDREYIGHLKALAALKRTSLADLTRAAMDRTYGEELKHLLERVG